MPCRSISVSLILILGTIAAGFVVRFLPLGLPRFAVKYGGSVSWALMIYWIVSTLLQSWRLRDVALIAGSIATVVEFLKLYHSPAFDAFRLTLPGILLMGRFFSVWDIAAYWFAIILGCFLDSTIRRHIPS